MRTCVSILLVLTAACTANTFDTTKDDAGNPINPVNGGDGGTGGDGAVAPGAEAVYVSSSKGSATGDGSKTHPFASLEAAIAKAGSLPVYACAETYAEQVHFVAGTNVYGYYECNTWTKTTAHAKIVSPLSPTAIATGISMSTTVEAVDIVAPDFTDKSQSSIALFATSSPALTIKNATIHAGTGGKGHDGTAGVQLTDTSAKNGSDAWADGICTGSACTFYLGSKTLQPAGGTSTCVGETGHDPGPGGEGGNPGEFQSVQFGLNNWIWNAVNNDNTGAGLPSTPTSQTAQGGSVGIGGSNGAAGANGKDGQSGLDFGTITSNGTYAPSEGTTGTAGNPGQGGGGSGGYNALASDYSASTYKSYYAWGEPGAGGGAGGCPGLPGMAGRGGGASFAVVAMGAGLTLDTVTIESSKGGDGGASGIPSAPTAGGFGGHTGGHVNGAGNGGAGGNAGVSGNGGGGPSLGIAYDKVKPTMLASTVKQGAGGSGVAVRTVNGQTIPASDAGMSSDVYMFGQ